MQLVGRDTAPSIIKAQEIKSALADMDADAANELLVPKDPGEAALYEKHRVQASEALIEAAHNITYGKAESEPIEAIDVHKGTYERQVQQALDLEDEGHLDKAREEYREASKVMDLTLLAQAELLDKTNNDVLENEYEARSTSSSTARVFVLLLGFALALGLVMTQLFLSRRMRRTINPALLAATLLTLGFTFFAFYWLHTEQSELEAARKGAFTSVHALLQAKAIAYSANSDESRSLLDPAHAAPDLQAFDGKVAQLRTLPPNMTTDQQVRAMSTGKPIPGFSGLLADEYNNVTLPHEQEAAINSVSTLDHYLDIDKQLRSYEQTGQSQKALVLCVGTQPDQSDGAFAQFDAALDKTYQINKDEFDRAVESGFNALKNLELESLVAGVILAVLIFFGFAPRIREYQ